MPGGRVPKTTRNDPGNAPDKGLAGRGQHHISQPGPTLVKHGPATVAGVEKFEQGNFAAVRGGAGQTQNTKHGGHGKDSGGPDLAFAKEPRAHNDASALFAAQKGHSPKRSAGQKTGTDIGTARRLSTSGS